MIPGCDARRPRCEACCDTGRIYVDRLACYCTCQLREVFAWSDLMGCVTELPVFEAKRKGYAWGDTIEEMRAAMAAQISAKNEEV